MTDVKEATGKIIEKAIVDDGGCHLTFTDGTKLSITDDGQTCCENRYVTCDDNPSDLVGHPYAGWEAKDTNYSDTSGGDCHEEMFVEVRAGLHTITMVTHNEHSGYYGGFWVVEHYQ